MAAAAEKRELHDLNNTRIKHGVPCYNMLDVSEILTSITRSFRIHCHLCLHVKKRFPKRKIKAWIVQTLLACSKLLSPIQTKIHSAINPWFILYQLNIVLIKIKDIFRTLTWFYYLALRIKKGLNELRLWETFLFVHRTGDANPFGAKRKLWMYH